METGRIVDAPCPTPASGAPDLQPLLERIYLRLNRKEMVDPDPLAAVLGFADKADREVAGLLAAGLAYGRVAQIMKSLHRVLTAMPEPRRYVLDASDREIENDFAGFRHRWSTGCEVSALLIGVKRVLEEHGSLEAAFLSHCRPGQQDVLAPLQSFVAGLRAASGRPKNSLLACPSGGSACKRMNLYLRWMVRRDQVDPGGWDNVCPSFLIVPLDTHMHGICRRLGLTGRKQADLKTALEITGGFRKISPRDPVKYDFALTRLGIREDTVDELRHFPPEVLN